MSATLHGAGCGIVLGLVVVLLAQQLDFLDLSVLLSALEDLILGALVGGVLGGMIGWGLGRRYLRLHPARASP